MTQPVDLTLRTVPAQKRAEKTYQHILEVTSELFAEVGFDRFNTNLLAQRANIRVATIYRYFPNKFAILSTLVEDWLDKILEGMNFINELADPDRCWREIFCRIIDTYVRICQEQKGIITVRRAVLAIPELKQIEDRMMRDFSVGIVRALEARGIPQDSQQIKNFVHTFLSTASQAVDLAFIKGEKKRQAFEEIIAETKLQQISFLANYLD